MAGATASSADAACPGLEAAAGRPAGGESGTNTTPVRLFAVQLLSPSRVADERAADAQVSLPPLVTCEVGALRAPGGMHHTALETPVRYSHRLAQAGR
jgi:hypothetical protein